MIASLKCSTTAAIAKIPPSRSYSVGCSMIKLPCLWSLPSPGESETPTRSPDRSGVSRGRKTSERYLYNQPVRVSTRLGERVPSQVMADVPFVPPSFEPPAGLVRDAFVLEPLDPRHNELDYSAW